MKYIDADLLLKEIEQLKKHSHIMGDNAINSSMRRFYEGAEDSCNRILAILDTLQKSAKRGYKDCNGCEYNRTIKDQIGWQFHSCFGGEYKGKPIAEIELCPLKVAALPEQPVTNCNWLPVEGLEEEIDNYIENERYFPDDERPIVMEIASHFAEWGAENLKK